MSSPPFSNTPRRCAANACPTAKTWLLPTLLLSALVACAKVDTLVPVSAIGNLAPRVELTDVPFYPQAERDDCGPAALAMMLGSTGLERSPQELAASIYTPGRTGTLQADIIQAVRRDGRLGLRISNLADLLAALNQGHPVLVLQNLGLLRWPIWHYAVVMGYDLNDKMLYLHSGTEARLALSFSAFDKTWKDSSFWALTVTRPDHLPAYASETDVLNAASALEDVGQSQAAMRAYGAILERWPSSLAALMGWGNARYVQGDHRAASLAFRQAVTLHPTATEAWNNLAYSLAELGRLEEALTAAREAVRQGGPHRAAAEATLLELQEKKSGIRRSRQQGVRHFGSSLS